MSIVDETFGVTEFVRVAPIWKFWERTKIAHIYCTKQNCEFYVHILEPCDDSDFEILNIVILEHLNFHKSKPKKKAAKKPVKKAAKKK